jgi:hypothetical protein
MKSQRVKAINAGLLVLGVVIGVIVWRSFKPEPLFESVGCDSARTSFEALKVKLVEEGVAASVAEKSARVGCSKLSEEYQHEITGTFVSQDVNRLTNLGFVRSDDCFLRDVTKFVTGQAGVTDVVVPSKSLVASVGPLAAVDFIDRNC